jgi:hypothetical protein
MSATLDGEKEVLKGEVTMCKHIANHTTVKVISVALRDKEFLSRVDRPIPYIVDVPRPAILSEGKQRCPTTSEFEHINKILSNMVRHTVFFV